MGSILCDRYWLPNAPVTMAVFLINICKFNGCGITFPSLGDLIQHIEDTHIGESHCCPGQPVSISVGVAMFENIFNVHASVCVCVCVM